MSTAAVELVTRALYPLQQAVADAARRFTVVAAGRRWGKSLLATDRLVDAALATGRPVAWCAPSYPALEDQWNELKRILAPMIARRDEQLHRLYLANGSRIDMLSMVDADAIRHGQAYAYVVVDEAATIPRLQYVFDYVLRPMLADFTGALLMISTPKGHNEFAAFYARGRDRTEPDWISFQFASRTSPYVRPSEIEDARRSLPARAFQQEWDAQFLEGGGAVFRNVREAAVAVPQRQPIPGHQYIVGVDVGRVEDATVFCVIDTTLAPPACVHLDRFIGIAYDLQLSRLILLADRFKVRHIVMERNSAGDPLVERLQRSAFPVLPFQTTARTKAPIIEALALAFERGDLRIVPDDTLVGELMTFAAERLPISGLWRYAAPPGGHDDTVMALALAWWGVGRTTVPPALVRLAQSTWA